MEVPRNRQGWPIFSNRKRCAHPSSSWDLVATFALLIGASLIDSADAQSSCTISGGQVTANSGTSCTVPPDTVLSPSSTAITANGGQVAANNITINPAQGGGSTGLLANGASGAITAGNLALMMNGYGSGTAAKAMGAGTITLNSGTTITFNPNGGGNTGLFATGTGSQLTATGVTLSMPLDGGNDTGAEAAGGATVTIHGGAVTMHEAYGGGDIGLYATGAGSTLSTNGTTMSISGSNARGAFLQNGGTMSLTGGSLTALGSNTYGFLLQAPAGVTNTLTVSGTTVSSAADAFAVQGGTAKITLSDGMSAISTNGILLSAAQSGGAPAVVTFSADNSTLTGAIVTDSTSTNNAALTGNTLWNMTGSSNLTSLVNDQSLISVAPPSGDPTLLGSYKTLTVTNYTGASGQIVLNTYLDTDGSPSDRVVINGGTASGTTALEIHNSGGPGAATNANGILVVNAINGGTTATNAFSLASEVRGGAFDYRLYQGGLGGSDPQDWFLRSDFEVPPSPGTSGAVTLPFDLTEDDVLPPDPPPDPLPPGYYPIIGPEVATDSVVQPLARQLGLTTLGTLHERIGDTLSPAQDGAGADPASETWARSMWGRVIGQQIANRYQAFTAPSVSGRITGFQAGLDLWHGGVFAGHRDTAGLYFAYLNSDAAVTGLVTSATATAYTRQSTGSVNLDAYSIGGYWTHYGPGGWYLDAVLQGTLYAGKAATQFANLPTHGTGFVSSLEAGYPVPLPLGPGFVLEPQAQILWQRVDFGSAYDGEGQVGLGQTAGTTGRIGLRGRWKVTDSVGRVWEPYARVNLWHDWNAKATTTFASDQALLREDATRLQLGAGLTTKLAARFSFYAEAGYQFTIGRTQDVNIRGIEGDVGLRYTW